MSSKPDNKDQSHPKTQRLFFALWPQESIREQVRRHCKSLLRHGGGRPVDPGNLHFTLAFLGNVDVQQQECVEQVADQIRLPRFEFSVDQAGHWPKPRVLWIGPSQMPDVMLVLANELRDGAIQCGIQMDMRPFRAHMTLMRKVSRAREDMSIRPFNWQASSFVLVRSITYAEGVKYQVIKEWALES
ncbi:RNA 2',3'-cyclic phosphodiesterase [Kaarinaea lacus]